LNLRDPEGKELFLKLVAQCDVIAANFKPGTLESLGFGYDTLSAINPGLIMLNSSAFGATGPWSGRLGYGPLVRAVAGLTSQWRYEDDRTSFSDAVTIYPDHVAGRVGAIGVLALLIRRARTGRGGTVDVAQLEVMLAHMAPQIAAIALRRAGVNVDHAIKDAPWGVFPAQGDDEWCVVTVRDDAEWRQFCNVAGRDDLLQDPALMTICGRVSQRERIDQAVREWLATRSAHDAMTALQAAGVPAAAMLRVSELPHFPHFAERQFFRRENHPKIAAPFFVETAPVRSENLPDPPDGPAPLAGEHTVEIARTAFNLSDAEIDRLIRAKVLEVAQAGAGRT
jgi:crotonobetainyl-CoA:carnitine CoA-transferase CaiB-like acyl-CoA transferase